MLKVLDGETQALATTAFTVNGPAISVLQAKTFSAQIAATVNTPAAKTFADGTRQIQVIDFLSDSAGSLNSKYFLVQSTNALTNATKLFYIWFNINSAGVDPAIAGRTAIPITGATGVSANTLVTSCKTALDALTNDFATSTASTSHLTIAQANPGVPGAAADGAATSTGFTFNAPSTAGVASKVNPVLDTISITAHGLPTGLKLQASSTGTLPAGITTSTDYFVIVVDANTIQLASSLALAKAGTAIDLTDYGTNASTGTLTPTAVAGGSVGLIKSNDGVTWVAQGTVATISATGTQWLEWVDPTSKYVALQFSITAGSFSASSQVLVKGNQ